ncbi:P-loop containing nucleoside triphosphate hydrolase protein [Multifurca ochricompacta]|uniref:P-loop containing nucleoside triphosphate hydrolase protein n=1 Tax=Multifurca ochricompacta TaxID=376703 RepID=A0AAD4M7E5_9AGAM|nr:P-loop containing nucleoside triphosphate hydrolase protein [Multifurca ochricompacta]
MNSGDPISIRSMDHDSTPSTNTSFDYVDHGDNPVGLSDPRFVARKRKMLDAVNRLRATGAHLDLDIPVIVSSLIEAISGITLPRSSGTCTRCPTECQLLRSFEPWRCIVSLRIATDENGVVLAQPREFEFGDPIFEKPLVTERIRRAQCAILNPSTPTHQFLHAPPDQLEERQLSFSSNSVCLEISGKDIDDLSFVDLPGLIVGGEPRDAALVQQLAEAYICKGSCIILLTIACETDYENQSAHRLAAQFDPHGSRTIGVLTKPDRIPLGEEGNWTRLIQGHSDGKEGRVEYFSVKNPDSQDIRNGITYELAREKEFEFFSTRTPWSNLDQLYQRRLGTEKLTRRLGQVLSNLISKRLPELQEELDKLLDQTSHDLSRLPNPPSSEPVGEMLRLIGAFVRSVERLVDGAPDEDGLIQALRGPRVAFKRAIRQTAPDFRPVERPRKINSAMTPPPPKFLSNEETECEHQPSDASRAIFVEDVMKRADSAVTRELPNNFPFIVKKHYIGAIVKRWDSPSRQLFELTKKELNKRVQAVIEDHLSQYTYGHLKQRVMSIVQSHIQKCADAAEQHINFLLEEEQEPFTMNEHYFMEYRSKFLGYYKGIRQRAQSNFMDNLESNEDGMKNAMNIVISYLAVLGLNPVDPTSLARLLPPDPMEPAIEIMAEVRAYFQVAYKRYVDNVPMGIDRTLLRGVRVGLEEALFNGISISGPGGHERCRMLLSEPEDVVEHRNELQKRRDRLLMAKEELVQAFD